MTAYPCYSGGMVDAGDLKSPGRIDCTGSSPVCSSLKISGLHENVSRFSFAPNLPKYAQNTRKNAQQNVSKMCPSFFGGISSNGAGLRGYDMKSAIFAFYAMMQGEIIGGNVVYFLPV